MDRRGFLKALVGGVAAGAAVRTWPFRVYSFPTEIVIPEAVNWADLNALTGKYMMSAIADEIYKPSPIFWMLKDHRKQYLIGVIDVAKPDESGVLVPENSVFRYPKPENDPGSV